MTDVNPTGLSTPFTTDGSGLPRNIMGILGGAPAFIGRAITVGVNQYSPGSTSAQTNGVWVGRGTATIWLNYNDSYTFEYSALQTIVVQDTGTATPCWIDVSPPPSSGASAEPNSTVPGATESAAQ